MSCQKDAFLYIVFKNTLRGGMGNLLPRATFFTPSLSFEPLVKCNAATHKWRHNLIHLPPGKKGHLVGDNEA